MKQALRFFENAHAKDRLAHLYLIHGLKGSGKLKLALEVSFLILRNEHTFDETLKKQIFDRKIPNVMVIEPDGATIKKEQIMDLQKEFSKTSLVSGSRIYIISQVEKMTVAASNSLLKFMEEPSNKQTYGFLLTDDQDVVLPTIKSRSQHVGLKSLDEVSLKNVLLEEQVDPAMAAILPYLTKNVDEAMTLSIDPNYIEMMHLIKEFAEAWQDKQQSLVLFFLRNARLVTIDRVYFKSFLELLLLFFLDLIYYKTNQPIVMEFMKEDIQSASARLSIDHIEKITAYIKETIKKQTYYINMDLALDHLAYMLDQSR
ncbi:MAG: hypothetical protein ACNA7K_03795 [Acholeplasmataceae bacterium]|jgi:DNA polymerase III subunit delta'